MGKFRSMSSKTVKAGGPPLWKRVIVSSVNGLRALVLKVLRMPDSFVFGFPNEWAFFQKEHPKFVEALDCLAETQQKAMKRTFVPSSAAEELVFFSGSLVMEDFVELWVLAGNGCGLGALKVLRGMYERTVTAAYVSQFPEQARRFWNFGVIAHRRVLNNAKELYGLAELKKILGADHFDRRERSDFHLLPIVR